MVSTNTRMLSLPDFMYRYEKEGPFEFIDGKVIPLHPVKFGHARFVNHFAELLRKTQDADTVYSETPFILPSQRGKTKWVKGSRVPDVMFIRADRLQAYMAENPDYESEPLSIVPDIVLEVVSPTDKFKDVEKKIKKYLSDGVHVVWVVYLQSRTIAVHKPNAEPIVLIGEQVLSGGDLVPGFEVPINQLFE